MALKGYRKPSSEAVEWKPSNLDECVLRFTGEEYRHQEGSGRHEVLKLIADGMSFSDWTKKAVRKGFDVPFCVLSILAHQKARKLAFELVPPSGKQLSDLLRKGRGRKKVSAEGDGGSAGAAPRAKATAAKSKKVVAKAKSKAAPKRKTAAKAKKAA